jgi:hypothetical protein
MNRVWNRDVVVGGDVHQLSEIVRAREVEVCQYERDLQRLLDCLLCMLCELSDYVDIGVGVALGVVIVAWGSA